MLHRRLRSGGGERSFSTFADGECTRLEGLPLPSAAKLKASTTKYALAILPTESGGFGYYKYDDDNDMEDHGEGGTSLRLFQVLLHNKHSTLPVDIGG